MTFRSSFARLILSAAAVVLMTLTANPSVAAAPYHQQLSELLKPASAIKAPAGVAAGAAGTLCGVSPASTVDDVLQTWGKPSGAVADKRFVLEYGEVVFNFGKRLRLKSCTVSNKVAGLAAAQLATWKLGMGQTKAAVRTALGPAVARNADAQPVFQVNGKNAHGLAAILFDSVGKVKGWRLNVAALKRQAAAKKKSAAAPIHPWRKKLRSLMRVAGSFAPPAAQSLLWKGGEKARVLGVLPGASVDDVVAVWGNPSELLIDADKVWLGYTFKRKGIVGFRVAGSRMQASVRPGGAEGLAVKGLLPKKVEFGATVKQVVRALGKPESKDVHVDMATVTYKALAPGVRTAEFEFEPFSEAGKPKLDYVLFSLGKPSSK